MPLYQIEGKLYKIRLVNRYGPLFEQNFSPKNWKPFIDAIDDDYNKVKEFNFHHPIRPDIQYYRKYIYSPANGETQLAIGRLRYKMDCANVRIVLHSVHRNEPYIAVYDYERSFEKADHAIDMLVYSFNQALRNTHVAMTYTPWYDPDDQWLEDCESSYKHQLHLTGGKNCPTHGVEEWNEKQDKPDTEEKHKKHRNMIEKEKDDGFCIKVYSPGNFIAKEIIINGGVHLGGNSATEAFSDEQIAQALTNCTGRGKVIDAKWKWAGAYWYLRWTCNFPIDTQKFCERIDGMKLNVPSACACSYESIRKICTLSFMDYDPRKMESVKVSKNDQAVFSYCREIVLKLGEELGKAYLPKV